MSDSFGQGAPQFGLRDAKTSRRLAAGSYNNPLTDIFSVEMAQATMQLVNGLARGDDRITAAVSVLEGIELQLRFTGLQVPVVAEVTGKSATTITSKKIITYAGGEHMPYLGLIIKAIAADLSSTWLWFPMAKILQNFRFFSGEYGRFNSPEVTVQCVADPSYGLYSIITHPNDVEIDAMPPSFIEPIE